MYRNLQKKDYFEGWYIRFTSSDDINFAVIFAITKDQENPHCFIQVFKDLDKLGLYFSFPVSSFSYNSDKQIISIDNNTLSLDKLYIDHEGVKIDVTITNQDFIKNYKGPNSAMGYLYYAPLECFQEIVYLDSSTNGTVIIGDKAFNISGKGYMEKTYGKNFPSNWIWIQSNHNIDGSALSFSVGKVPVLFFSIKGFLAFLKVDKKLYRFSTYNFSRITVHQDKVIIKKGRIKLIISPSSKNPTELVGPMKKGKMVLPVYESISSTCDVLLTRGNKVLYKGSFTNVGLELMYQ